MCRIQLSSSRWPNRWGQCYTFRHTFVLPSWGMSLSLMIYTIELLWGCLLHHKHLSQYQSMLHKMFYSLFFVMEPCCMWVAQVFESRGIDLGYKNLPIYYRYGLVLQFPIIQNTIWLSKLRECASIIYIWLLFNESLITKRGSYRHELSWAALAYTEHHLTI